jgi:hypothetical protein
VEMPGDHADGAPRCAWNPGIPERGRQMLHEVRCDPAVGAPGRPQRRTRIREWRHSRILPLFDAEGTTRTTR